MILGKVTARQWAIGAFVFIAFIVLLNWVCGKRPTATEVKAFVPKIDTRAIDSLEKQNKRITAERDSIQGLYNQSLKTVQESSRKATRFALALEIAKKAKDTTLIIEACDSLQEVVIKQEAVISDHMEYVAQLKARNDSIEQGLLAEIDRLKSALGITTQSNEFLSDQLTLVGKKNKQLQRKLGKKFHLSAYLGYGPSYNNLGGIRLGPNGGVGATYTIF